MVKGKVFILAAVLVLICSSVAFAGNKLGISGTLSTSIEALSDDGELIDRERLNLEFKKEFGFVADKRKKDSFIFKNRKSEKE